MSIKPSFSWYQPPFAFYTTRTTLDHSKVTITLCWSQAWGAQKFPTHNAKNPKIIKFHRNLTFCPYLQVTMFKMASCIEPSMTVYVSWKINIMLIVCESLTSYKYHSTTPPFERDERGNQRCRNNVKIANNTTKFIQITSSTTSSTTCKFINSCRNKKQHLVSTASIPLHLQVGCSSANVVTLLYTLTSWGRNSPFVLYVDLACRTNM